MPSRPSKRPTLTHRPKPVVDCHSEIERDYYGAMIRGAETGPRRELRLLIEIWPKGKSTFGGGDFVTIRFGAIENYEEVRPYFASVPIEGLHYLRELSECTPRRHVFEMEFDRTGDRVRIIAGNALGLRRKSKALRKRAH